MVSFAAINATCKTDSAFFDIDVRLSTRRSLSLQWKTPKRPDWQSVASAADAMMSCGRWRPMTTRHPLKLGVCQFNSAAANQLPFRSSTIVASHVVSSAIASSLTDSIRIHRLSITETYTANERGLLVGTAGWVYVSLHFVVLETKGGQRLMLS